MSSSEQTGRADWRPPLSQQQVADMLGITRGQADAIERRALRKLRKYFRRKVNEE